MRIAAAPVELNPVQRPDAARIDKAAREFEGVFAQQLIKSMRDASFGDALFPGENQLYRDLYDQRLAKSLTDGEGLGLAKVIARQLGGGTDGPALDTRIAPPAAPLDDALDIGGGMAALPEALGAQTLDLIAGRPMTQAASGDASRSPMDGFIDSLMARARPLADAATGGARIATAAVAQAPAALEQASRAAAESFAPRSPERFVASIWSHAQAAARELGVDAKALVAQAALETGWGRRTISRGDGSSANNLFGIKATGWKGDRATVNTHEYSNGVRHTERADFRAYASPAESFADYVRLLKQNPRYRQALEAGGDVRRFAGALQQAGYATDPRYADKLSAIANGPTLGRALSTISQYASAAASASPTRATAPASINTVAEAAERAAQALLRR
ncbi:flagellar assembly peptidoglycan hydrolase FlgJ [Luteimonas sp. 100069]|uniref:flagellar assembly peptidoglycan hydrolase FlgJ n=1 Tax=Luteimonas sp. 100069 TaxID=2006109 RepID=UPI000F4FE5C1|nr:flagellar assembly peptidoglycan hydrolase FlgJ [Luteimonas sp. 100069]RPD88653.1 flagellar assembly peptidoglycan hydrolase FlgJ [Luteimonas sp. 100069]